MRNATRSAGALAVLTLALVACKAEEPASSPPAATKAAADAPAASAPAPTRIAACESLSADDVKGLLGSAVEGATSSSGGADVCTWTGPTGKTAIIQIYATARSFEQSREAFERMYAGQAEDISGIGDKAFYIHGKTASFPTATLSVVKGAQAASVQVMEPKGDPAKLKTEAVALTKVVVGKL